MTISAQSQETHNPDAFDKKKLKVFPGFAALSVISGGTHPVQQKSQI